MNRRYLLSLAVPMALAACDEATETVTFKSDKERACYEKAQAEITNPNTSLARDKDGNFVKVTKVDGFVRDVDPSETFERCMVTVERHAEIGPEVKNAAISLTAAEKAEWDKLSDADKRAALIFIQNGGTLAEFLAQR